MTEEKNSPMPSDQAKMYQYLVMDHFKRDPNMALAGLERTLIFSEPYGWEEPVAWNLWKELNKRRDLDDTKTYPHLRMNIMLPQQRMLEQLQAAQQGALRLAVTLTQHPAINDRKGHIASRVADEWAELYIELKHSIPGFPVDSVKDCVMNPLVAKPLRIAAMTVASHFPELRTLLQTPSSSTPGAALPASTISH